MGSTRSHPLPPGIFVQMPSPPLTRSQPIVAPSEFDGWTDRELVSEINRLRELLKIHDECKKKQEMCVEVRVMTEEEVQNDPEMTAQVEKVDQLHAPYWDVKSSHPNDGPR